MAACRDGVRWKLCGFTAHRCWTCSARMWRHGSTTAYLQTRDGWTSGTWSEARGKTRRLPTPLLLHAPPSEDREWTRRRDVKGDWWTEGAWKRRWCVLVGCSTCGGPLPRLPARTTWTLRLEAGPGEIPCVDPEPPNKCTKQDSSSARQDQDLASRLRVRLRMENSALCRRTEDIQARWETRTGHECVRITAKHADGQAQSLRHAVWLQLTKSSARKLDSDARVWTWSEPCDATEKCETDVMNTLQHLVGRSINWSVVTQAAVPGSLGGIGLRLSSSCADAHSVGRTQATTKLVKEALGTNREFVDEAVAKMASESVADRRAKDSEDGQMTMTEWSEQMVNSGPWGRWEWRGESLEHWRRSKQHACGRGLDRRDEHNCWNLRGLVWKPPGRCVPAHVKTGWTACSGAQLRLALWSDDDTDGSLCWCRGASRRGHRVWDGGKEEKTRSKGGSWRTHSTWKGRAHVYAHATKIMVAALYLRRK